MRPERPSSGSLRPSEEARRLQQGAERPLWGRALVATLLLLLCGAGSQHRPAVGLESPCHSAVEDAQTKETSSTLDVAARAALEKAGIRPLEVPATNADLAVLGRMLFFDVRLSGNKNMACGTCHYHRSGATDGLSLAVGEGSRGVGDARELGAGKVLARHAPSLYGRGFLERLFWDGRVARVDSGVATPSRLPLEIAAQATTPLAAQALFPVLAADEMRGAPGSNELAAATSDEEVWRAIMERLLADPALRALFARAYPGTQVADLNFGHAARALAAFETAQWSGSRTPLDAFLGGDSAALAEPAKRGALLFAGKARCASCHAGPLLSDESFHALAVPQIGPGLGGTGDDLGRALVTGAASDAYAFRTPPLRNLGLTAPYMHDGCFTTLKQVVRHHLDPRASLAAYEPASAGIDPALGHDTDPAREAARAAALDSVLATPVVLSEDDLSDLLAFLGALTDPAQADALAYKMSPGMMDGMMPNMMMMQPGWKKKAQKGMTMAVMMGR